MHTSCLHSNSGLHLTHAHLPCLQPACEGFMWSSLLAAKHEWMTAWLPCHVPSCRLPRCCWPAVSRLHCCCDLGGSITCAMHLPCSAKAVKPQSLFKVALQCRIHGACTETSLRYAAFQHQRLHMLGMCRLCCHSMVQPVTIMVLAASAKG